MKWIEVKQLEPKVWGLFVAGSLFGTSKNRFDCDHAKVILENAINRVQSGLDGLEADKVSDIIFSQRIGKKSGANFRSPDDSVPDGTGFSS
jgi:hypothetical protein